MCIADIKRGKTQVTNINRTGSKKFGSARWRRRCEFHKPITIRSKTESVKSHITCGTRTKIFVSYLVLFCSIYWSLYHSKDLRHVRSVYQVIVKNASSSSFSAKSVVRVIKKQTKKTSENNLVSCLLFSEFRVGRVQNLFFAINFSLARRTSQKRRDCP